MSPDRELMLTMYFRNGPALPFIPLVKIIERVSLFLFLKD